MTEDRTEHWDSVYRQKSEEELSWHQDDPSVSLELCDLAGLDEGTSVIDIGGGTSLLAVRLVERGLRDVVVLDVSAAALEHARGKLGRTGEKIDWIVADITTWKPSRKFDIWHDRAVFHFLVDAQDRAAYVARLSACMPPGGHAVIATFAPDGPEKCSGLPVVRYDPQSLGRVLGHEFTLVTHRRHLHHTPWGSPQSFQFSLFRKSG